MENSKTQWEQSYLSRDNFVFYPSEEVIRFVSRNICKRIGLREYTNVVGESTGQKVLDLGCGIGRHVVFLQDLGLESYGVDLSEEAIKVAREWAQQRNMPDVETRLVQGDVRQLVWTDDFFDHVISCGVLDSMPFEIATLAVAEIARVTKTGGLFYCDVISGDDSTHAREYQGEEIVATTHENGTVQSYFNYGKVERLFGSAFDVVECYLIRKENISTGAYISRYHLIFRKK